MEIVAMATERFSKHFTRILRRQLLERSGLRQYIFIGLTLTGKTFQEINYIAKKKDLETTKKHCRHKIN